MKYRILLNVLQVKIEGKRTTVFSRLLLDDITFSSEPCEQIPKPGMLIIYLIFL